MHSEKVNMLDTAIDTELSGNFFSSVCRLEAAKNVGKIQPLRIQ